MSSGAVGGHGGVVLGPNMASPYFKVQEPLPTSTPCFHTSRTSFPHPEFCYEMSMVCNDGMLLAGKLRELKQWAQFHQGLDVQLVTKPETKWIKPLSRVTSANFWIK
jgi:hypothetical protein